MCSVTRFLPRCARRAEPASVEGMAVIPHAPASCPRTTRRVAHVKCGPASVGVCSTRLR